MISECLHVLFSLLSFFVRSPRSSALHKTEFPKLGMQRTRRIWYSNRYCMCIGTDSFTGLGKRKKPRRQLQTSVTPVIKEGSTTVAKVGKDMIDLLLVQTLSSTTSVNLAISMAVRRFGTLILTCKMSSETEPSIEACCLISSQG